MIRSSRLGKRGERVVTIVRRDAMDAGVSSDERHERVRQRRVVLAPLGWCQVSRDVRGATVTNKVMDTGESTQ